MELSIIVPTLNEAKNLRHLLPMLRKVTEEILPPESYEIVVVDADSRDGTHDVATQNGARVVNVGKGYGVALAAGISASRGSYILTMDADLSHSPYIVPILYAHRHEAEVLIASRYIERGFNNSNPIRAALSRLLNLTYRIVLDLPFRDLSSGFRLYDRRIFDEVQPTARNYVVLQEILMKAYAQGFRIKEVPFHYSPRKFGTSKSRLLVFGKEYLLNLFKFWKLRNSIDCADYDERAFNSRIWLQKYWQRKRYRIIMDYARDFGSILDVGCGSSLILDGLPQSVGCDVRLNKLRYKRAPYRRLLQGSVFRLPFRDGAFEATVFSQVIEHLPRDPVILDEIVRVTQPGGCVIVGTPDYATHWTIIEKIYGWVHPTGYADEHITHYTLKSLRRELEDRGCRYADHKYVLGAELIMKFMKGA